MVVETTKEPQRTLDNSPIRPLKHHDPNLLDKTRALKLGHEESIYNVSGSDPKTSRGGMNTGKKTPYELSLSSIVLDSSGDGIVPFGDGRIMRQSLSEDVLLSDPEKYVYEIHDAAAAALQVCEKYSFTSFLYNYLHPLHSNTFTSTLIGRKIGKVIIPIQYSSIST